MSTIYSEMPVKDLCELYLISEKDLEGLLKASDIYLKFRSSSKRSTWTMCVNAYFEWTIRREEEIPVEQATEEKGKFTKETVKIKVSTYHDVKEVKWDRAEKQSEVQRKFLVMGTKMKEEMYRDRPYGLRYWMIFEIQPYGKYKCSVPSVNNWSEPFKSYEAAAVVDFKYQHIKEEKKPYGNLIIRRERQCMFQVNYHIRDSEDSTLVPMNGNVPNGHLSYVDLQSVMERLRRGIEQLGVLEYKTFIGELRKVYQACECQLKRLDSFVI